MEIDGTEEIFMLTAKEKTLKFVEALADDLSEDEIENRILYRRVVRKIVEQGRLEKEAGLTIPHDEMKRIFGIE